MGKTIIPKASLVISLLLLGTYTSANPRIVDIQPILSGPVILNNTPVRFSILFSEPVYGFEKEDLLSNGRVLTLEGRQTSYTVLIIPTESQLIIDILADAVRNINQKGNNLLRFPFVWRLDDSAFSSTANFISPPKTPKQPPPKPIKKAAPPTNKTDIPPITLQIEKNVVSPPQPKPKKPPSTRSLSAKFALNAGAYNDAPSFINIEEQTDIKPERTSELTLGFELFHRPSLWRRGLGYFFLTGYQQSSYGSTAETAEASYTAIPLEFGMNIYFNDYISTGFGGIVHFNGEYTHKGNIGTILSFPDPIPLSITNGANSFDAGIPGFIFDLNFDFRVIGFSFRFLSLPLQNYADFEDKLLENNIQASNTGVIQTLNAIETFGIFFKLKV